MKKLKIFLLLSILLCLGFVLSSEVHAQGGVLPYLTFQSPSSFTLKVNDAIKHWDGSLYYSTDTTTWNVWDGTTTLSSVGNKLYLRGTGNTIITGTTSSDSRWVLAGSNIECIGNIENLLDYETVALGNHPAMAARCYRSVFYGCTGLTTAPSLPATTLANYCYENMFYGCTGLTTAPSLPATTLADYCYSSMFNGCTGLTTAPSLPATTLAFACYRRMFRECRAFKVSTTQAGTYQYAWRIPTSGYGTTATDWNLDMLYNTGGTFKSNPSINTTYYVENPPVAGFNITFEENGGTTISDIEEATELPNPLPTPTKENHTFLGWYYDSDFTNEAFADDPLTSDVTLYAKWVSGKIFEEGDVLPATTQLRISWDNIVTDYSDNDGGIYSNDIEFIRWYYPETGAAVLIFLDSYSAITGGPDIPAGYIDIDISHLDTDQRTITEVVTDTPFYWQDMATYDYLDPKPFKAYDVLPATTRLKIYINGIHGNGTDIYHISSTTDPNNSLTQGFYMTTVQSGSNYNLVIIINGVTITEYNSEIEPFPDYVIIDISHLSRSDRTIRYCDYPEEMSVMWEDLNPLDLESIYQEGYADGHQVAREYYGWYDNGYWYTGEEAWDLGNEYAREIYGYYDPITDQWLSVEEYLDRYGTEKMGQSDFYNNFDKYFIPAMIIVFGGAIVLTILKVFKGRE